MSDTSVILPDGTGVTFEETWDELPPYHAQMVSQHPYCVHCGHDHAEQCLNVSPHRKLLCKVNGCNRNCGECRFEFYG